ncbi:hypothetical protein TREMEDRAFT_32301 [Tremella mesenterica DSM 1558]|uniref:uncharacterized protein n=1 Tax=Tremella mesenterica (strain ATCC 24925 / CBS 8224 / DSM 1558 / NBRC 9311 / NRRL Y-6157 / RJB 2259-6 / UBC 559-6) TaxID=578456 RepID=UPI0003F498F0|nr:uncharacterized protein TREMEDRAFT_32301 [Tremella mesenterica DSM 1558]EIW68248.1 hypothetical protein TREMEDRAFT_32301 [Tremella mesenterica DSM 1558]
MALLATVGNHLSHLLHQFVFAFPTPTNSSTANAPVPLFAPKIDVGAIAGGIGPLTFAGSGYGVMLVLMGILLNRIHHIVRRPRLPPQPQPHLVGNSPLVRARQKVVSFMTSPSAPFYLRLPGIMVLCRAWVLFTILTLQVANFWPVDSPLLRNSSYGRFINRAGNWVGDMEMRKVSWEVFLSVCLGMICSGLANGLDRTRRRDMGEGFNLIGYAFLLHLYSSPLTHHRPPPAAHHGRPDVHALFQLWLNLTELTWLQTIELSEKTRRNQIIPTGVCGTLGLIHFVWGLSSSPLKFPSFTFMTHLMALILVVMITASALVKAFTFLFTVGYIPSPILANLLPHEGVIPSVEDDFGVTLLKIGIACIEQTQYSGLQNELVAIEEPKGPWLEISSGSSVVRSTGPASPRGGFNTEVTNIEVSRLRDPQSESEYWKYLRQFWRTFLNAVVNSGLKILSSLPFAEKISYWARRIWQRRWWYGPRSWRIWRRAAWAEPAHFRRRAILRAMEDYSRRQQMRWVVPVSTSLVETSSSAETSEGFSTAVQFREPTIDPSIHLRYLRGETELSDGDDEEFENDPEEEEWTDEDEGENESAKQTQDLDQHQDQNQTPGNITSQVTDDQLEEDQTLYRDLISPSSEDLQAVLLAHLTSRTSHPLTRRQYALLSSSSNQISSHNETLQDIAADRRMMMTGREKDEYDEANRRACVVCTVEPRDTILWPCRCLAVCNECRENLAARLPAKDHLCPCCRRKIEGYSRIYVP